MALVDRFANLLGVPVDTPEVQETLDAAWGVIKPHLILAVNPLPPEQQAALDKAQLRAALELWRWQQANAGSTMYADGQDYPTPVYRDVYYSVQPVLLHAGLVARGMA